MTQLETIKDYLLANFTEYNQGFANVTKPNGTELIIDEFGNYSGISDNKGNYFYIREMKESNFRPFTRSCRVLAYEKTSKCRIVSLIHNANEDAHSQILIDSISFNGGVVTRSVSEKTQVFFEETGTRNITDTFKNVSLLLIDFEITELLSAKNCKPLICEC